MKIYRLRNCYLNQAERRVIKDGKYLELTPKTFDVLLLLIENCGEIVSKDDILGKVWNGSYVEEGNLAVHISKLRRTLGETKTQPFIETAQGSGYRFVAPLQEVSQSDWDKNASRIKSSPEENLAREWIFDSIAVLPLGNESGDAEIEYLADGLTESFINSLSRLPHLRVIARNTVFRYKNKAADAKQVGETLGVATVLTGRIRAIKEHLTISIELTKTEDGTQLWGTQFNRSFTDIFEIQESIFIEVLEKLKFEISNTTKQHYINSITKNSESYKLYLKGKYLLEKWTENKLYRAIECFEQSISYDPTNVHSYVEIIECYLTLYFSDHISYKDVSIHIEPYLTLITKLNESVDVVQAMYGVKKIYLDWQFDEGRKHLETALTINPHCLIARHRYSDFLLLTGKYIDALKELHQIIMIDPLSFSTNKRIGRLFYKMGRFEAAISYLNDALEIEPTDYIALAILGASLTELGKYQEAISIFQKSLDNYFNIEIASMIGYVHALEGNKDKANQVIEQIKSLPKDICQPEIKLARIYKAMGEKDKAYELLEQAYIQHNVDFVSITSDPRWNTIKNEPRFKALALKLGLQS